MQQTDLQTITGRQSCSGECMRSHLTATPLTIYRLLVGHLSSTNRSVVLMILGWDAGSHIFCGE